jgi:hypothetical protein
MQEKMKKKISPRHLSIDTIDRIILERLYNPRSKEIKKYDTKCKESSRKEYGEGVPGSRSPIKKDKSEKTIHRRYT